MGNVNCEIVSFYKQLGFTLIEIKSSVFRVEKSTFVLQTDHKDHTVDASTILYKDAEKIFALTADRTALLTELRDSGLLEEMEVKERDEEFGYPISPQDCVNDGHNTLARAIKAHINNLIKPDGV